MTAAEKYVAMRENGATFQDIANLYHVSKQAVHEAIRKYNAWNIKEATVPYDGLRRWMISHRMKVSELERILGVNLRLPLKSKNLRYDQIEMIIRLTGETYEELFMRKGDIA